MRVSTPANSETFFLQRWADDGGTASAIEPCRDQVDARGGGAMAGGGRSAVGGLVVLTGYAKERLGYLAALLSETLPKALWALPPELYGNEREIRLAHSHLVAGTTVVQLAETGQLGQFRDLAERAGARFLHVLSTPPSALGDTPDRPMAPDATHPASLQRVFVQASASLTTQLEVVLAAWKQLGDTP